MLRLKPSNVWRLPQIFTGCPFSRGSAIIIRWKLIDLQGYLATTLAIGENFHVNDSCYSFRELDILFWSFKVLHMSSLI